MNANGSGITQLTFNANTSTAPDWSPDGAQLAYIRPAPDYVITGTGVYVMNADGSSHIQLTTHSTDVWPDWRP
jgi:Tol biopolymer transport system component